MLTNKNILKINLSKNMNKLSGYPKDLRECTYIHIHTYIHTCVRLMT